MSSLSALKVNGLLFDFSSINVIEFQSQSSGKLNQGVNSIQFYVIQFKKYIEVKNIFFFAFCFNLLGLIIEDMCWSLFMSDIK